MPEGIAHHEKGHTMNTNPATMDDARAAWQAAVDVYAAHAAATFAELRAAFDPEDYAEDEADTLYADATPEQVAGDVFDAVRRMVSGSVLAVVSYDYEDARDGAECAACDAWAASRD